MSSPAPQAMAFVRRTIPESGRESCRQLSPTTAETLSSAQQRRSAFHPIQATLCNRRLWLSPPPSPDRLSSDARPLYGRWRWGWNLSLSPLVRVISDDRTRRTSGLVWKIYICGDGRASATALRHVAGGVPEARSRRDRLDRRLPRQAREMASAERRSSGRGSCRIARVSTARRRADGKNPRRLPELDRTRNDALESSGVHGILRQFIDRRWSLG